MLLRRSTSTWSESLIWDKSKARVLQIDDHIRGHRQDDGEGDGVQYIQTTPDRHVVAGEQRTGESQRAEHPEDHQWRMNSSGLCSRRGDVEHRVQRGQEQHRRLGRSRFPRGGDSELPIFRSATSPTSPAPISPPPYPAPSDRPRSEVQVTAEEIAHGWLRVRWEQSDPQPCRADVIGLLDDKMPPRIKACKRPGKRKCEDQTQQPKDRTLNRTKAL
jgi:hypothetical protein